MIDIVIRRDKEPVYVIETSEESASVMWTWIYEMLLRQEAYK